MDLTGLTTERVLRRGRRIGRGAEGAYYRLAYGPGEPHVKRLELAPGAPAPTRRVSLLHLACITDLHVLDAESPGRFEFVERLHGHAALRELLPAYRPQEFLQLHACEATIRALNAVAASPVTGSPLQLVLCAGDHVDNAQTNELHWAMALLAGGAVTPGSGGPTYEGVASVAWGDTAYWRPEPDADDYKTRWGFPAYPGLLAAARKPFRADGLRLPWLSCRGNHDALAQGTALPTPAFSQLASGARKARVLPRDLDLVERPEHLAAYLERFIAHPESFLTGPATTVTSDPARQLYAPDDFARTLAQAGGEPAGHGFSAHNAAVGSGYYVDDRYTPVRFVVLDTVNPGGHYQGSIGAAQAAWLEERLAEVHARHRDACGETVETGHKDRLVVILSHHGLDSLVNDRVAADGDDRPRVLGPALASILHRFPNVILWVNGHTHRNAVRPRPAPEGRSGGFWEVTTASLIGWPCQSRLVEIVDNGTGTLSVFCTMLDHRASPAPPPDDGLWRLAAIHRELAANDPHGGVASGTAGGRPDRNVELVVPAPFSLSEYARNDEKE